MIKRTPLLLGALLCLFSLSMPALADEYDNTYQAVVPPQPTERLT